MKLLQHNGLKLNKMKVWEKLCSKVFRPRWAQNGVLRFVKNHYRYQYLKLQHKGLKLTQMIFLEKMWHWHLVKTYFGKGVVLRFLRQLPLEKKGSKLGFLSIMGNGSMAFFKLF